MCFISGAHVNFQWRPWATVGFHVGTRGIPRSPWRKVMVFTGVSRGLPLAPYIARWIPWLLELGFTWHRTLQPTWGLFTNITSELPLVHPRMPTGVVVRYRQHPPELAGEIYHGLPRAPKRECRTRYRANAPPGYRTMHAVCLCGGLSDALIPSLTPSSVLFGSFDTDGYISDMLCYAESLTLVVRGLKFLI